MYLLVGSNFGGFIKMYINLLYVSFIVRDILICYIFDFMDLFNIEIYEMLVFNEYCLNCRII